MDWTCIEKIRSTTTGIAGIEPDKKKTVGKTKNMEYLRGG